MRSRYLFLSILLISGMDLFAQDDYGMTLPGRYDFAIRTAVNECFTAFQAEKKPSSDIFITDQLLSDGNAPSGIRQLRDLSIRGLDDAVSGMPSVKPYAHYLYQSIGKPFCAIGVAVAELKHPSADSQYNLIGRPLYFLSTKEGWKLFWIGTKWIPCRYYDVNTISMLDDDDKEVTLSSYIENIRRRFLTIIDDGSTPAQAPPKAPETKTPPETKEKPATPKPSQAVRNEESVSSDPRAVSYDKVAVKPTFNRYPASAFSEWVQRNLKYPEAAREQGLLGTTKVKFIIDEVGRVTSVKVVESAGKRTKKEFEDAIQQATFQVSQYEDQLAKLKGGDTIVSFVNTQKLLENANKRLTLLKRLYANKNYVLPEYEVLDNEVVRVVSSSPLWEPGKNPDTPVPVEYAISAEMKP